MFKPFYDEIIPQIWESISLYSHFCQSKNYGQLLIKKKKEAAHRIILTFVSLLLPLPKIYHTDCYIPTLYIVTEVLCNNFLLQHIISSVLSELP